MVSNVSTRTTQAKVQTQVLDDAATTAGYAPSILNTQPWHWRLHGGDLDLSVDRRRTLDVADPEGRLAILSCGAALHHVRVSLAAAGWHAAVARFPDSEKPGLVATIRAGGRIPVEPAATRDLRAVKMRHTDRRPLPDVHIDADKLRTIVTAVRAHGSSLQLLRPQQVFALATAADDAASMETADSTWQAELRYWTGGTRPLDTGLPATVIPAAIAPTTVTDPDFGYHGDRLIAEAHDRTAVFAILYGSDDCRLDWLRAGEALSAAWLTAIELEVSVLPLSATIEVPSPAKLSVAY